MIKELETFYCPRLNKHLSTIYMVRITKLKSSDLLSTNTWDEKKSENEMNRYYLTHPNTNLLYESNNSWFTELNGRKIKKMIVDIKVMLTNVFKNIRNTQLISYL